MDLPMHKLGSCWDSFQMKKHLLREYPERGVPWRALVDNDILLHHDHESKPDRHYWRMGAAEPQALAQVGEVNARRCGNVQGQSWRSSIAQCTYAHDNK